MKPHQERMARWHRQMKRRLCSHSASSYPPLVVLSYIAEGPIVENLIEVENLTIVICYEEPGRRFRPLVRMAGYTAQRTPAGVIFGGRRNSRLYKDVTSKPAQGARDHRLNLNNSQVFDLALRMEAHLRRQQGHPHKPRLQAIPVPRLVVGFRSSVANQLGLDQAHGVAGSPALGDVKRPAQPRDYFGLKLFPIDDVSQQLGHCTAVFADLAGWPCLRSVQLTDLRKDLCSQHGPAEFDLYNSEFRRWRTKRRPRSRSRDKQPQAA